MLTKIRSLYKNMSIQVRASIWFLMCSFLQKGISVITTPIFTRILTPQEYGEYSVFHSWMMLITPIVSLNLYSGVYSQGVVKFGEDRAKFSSSLQGLMLSLITVWIAIFVLFEDFFTKIFSISTSNMVMMLLLIWLSGAFQFWAVEQRVDYKYQKLVLITVLVSVVQPMLSVFLILNSEDKVSARILGMVITQLIFYCGLFVVQMKNGKVFFSKDYWKYALRFNLPLIPHYLALTVLSSSDRIMISKIVGDDKAGIYNLAYSISLIMSMFNTALLQTIEPWIYKKLKEKKVDEIGKIAYVSFGIIAAVNLLLIMCAPEVVAVFAPAEYMEAIYIIPAVALSVFFMFMYTFFATFEFYFEKRKYVAMATVGGAILNIVLNLICIKLFGYLAAGYTTLFAYILFALLHYYFMRKVCKEYLNDVKPYNGKIITIMSIVVLCIGALFLATYSNNLLRYSLIVIIIVISIIMRKKVIGVLRPIIGIVKSKKRG